MATVLIFSGTNLLTQKTHQLQIECPYGPLTQSISEILLSIIYDSSKISFITPKHKVI
jgi:hypothetical protein